MDCILKSDVTISVRFTSYAHDWHKTSLFVRAFGRNMRSGVSWIARLWADFDGLQVASTDVSSVDQILTQDQCRSITRATLLLGAGQDENIWILDVNVLLHALHAILCPCYHYFLHFTTLMQPFPLHVSTTVAARCSRQDVLPSACASIFRLPTLEMLQAV
jgi:hypothetical protein